MKANHEPRSFYIGRQRITINAGQVVTGRKSLALETGLHESKIERYLKCLEIEHQIEQQMNSKYRIITIKNWNEYQQTEQQMNNSCAADEQQMNTNKNDKNVKNDKNISIELDEVHGSESDVSSEDDTQQNQVLCCILYDGMVNSNEAEMTAHQKNPRRRDQKTRSWLKNIGQLQRIDGASVEQITFILRWLFESHKKNALFWQKNIRSGAKLREKWFQLVANCKEDYEKGDTSNHVFIS